MSQRMALLITTALTVFVMVMLAGIAWQVFGKSSLGALALQSAAPAQNEVASTVASPEAPLAAAPQVAADPASQVQVAAREAQYQQLIQPANARLDQAYKQQQELAKQIADQKAAQQASEKARVAVVS